MPRCLLLRTHSAPVKALQKEKQFGAVRGWMGLWKERDPVCGDTQRSGKGVGGKQVLRGGTKEMEGSAAMKMQTQRSGLWTQWEGRKERVRRMERQHGSIHTTVCRIDSHGNLLL